MIPHSNRRTRITNPTGACCSFQERLGLVIKSTQDNDNVLIHYDNNTPLTLLRTNQHNPGYVPPLLTCSHSVATKCNQIKKKIHAGKKKFLFNFTARQSPDNEDPFVPGSETNRVSVPAAGCYSTNGVSGRTAGCGRGFYEPRHCLFLQISC